MAKLLITVDQAKRLLKNREDAKRGRISQYDRKLTKRRILSEIKRDHNLPSHQKIVLFIEREDNPLYRVIRDKRTRQPLDNGLPEAVISTATKPAAKATAKKATPVAAKKATPVAKKPAAKKAAAKAVVKPAAKKAAAKAVVAKAAPAKKATKATKSKLSPTKTEACPLEVRATIGGKRVRLGFASDEAMKAKAVAKAKKDAGEA